MFTNDNEKEIDAELNLSKTDFHFPLCIIISILKIPNIMFIIQSFDKSQTIFERSREQWKYI